MNHLILFIGVAFTFFASAQSACDVNEVENQDPTMCTNDCCPTDCDRSPACPVNCQSKPCVCSLQFKRAANGTCISARDCPPVKCPENEHFDPCPNTFCSENCTNAHPPGPRCNFKFFHPGPVVICDPKCRCNDNYWRNSCNVCVPYNQCPSSATHANANEE